MRKRRVAAVAVFAAVIAAGVYFASPYVAMRGLRSAAIEGDVARVERFVDFPAVRDGLKSQLGAQMKARVRSDPDLAGNPLAGLATLLVGPLIDAMITPETVTRLVATSDTGVIEPGAAPLPTPTPTPTQPAAPAAGTASEDVRYGYKDLHTFAVTTRADDGRTIDFVMRREGVLHWRLKEIVLPPDLIAR